MYNKIASIILNSAKASGLSSVYVAQPDSLKEDLAGKVFILAEIDAKKNESKKIFNFLISALNDNYYNDEKILFRDKIKGLKIEDIFEAAVAKSNRNLLDFLNDEKIKFNSDNTNITIGVIYKNKLYFSNFGHNCALLIYHHNNSYEIINVESGATDVEGDSENAKIDSKQANKFFSSVISGEIPINSYFIFSNETLPEYLSNEEMINIVTKLPPITAAEQIKNVLSKINNYVPFLGIIIKNTTGINLKQNKEEIETNILDLRVASSLDDTEQKTERMLAPAGLFNFSKFINKFHDLLSSLRSKKSEQAKKDFRKTNYDNKKNNKISVLPNVDKINSLRLARSNSFLLKEKIFFKKKPIWLKIGLKRFFIFLSNFLNPHLWSEWFQGGKKWIKNLSLKNRWLFVSLGLLLLFFIINLSYTNWKHQRQIIQTRFNQTVNSIENKENNINAHLLYHDEAGANKLLIEAQALLAALPRDNKDQQDTYQRLNERLKLASDRIQKIVKVNEMSLVKDVSKLNIDNLIYNKGKLYGASGSSIYILDPNSKTINKVSIPGADKLSKSVSVSNDRLYYLDKDKIIRFNTKTKKSILASVKDIGLDKLNNFSIFNSNFYSLSAENNQIYRHNHIANNFGVARKWLKKSVDLKQASDLGIDGDIYVLQKDGSILKFRKGQSLDYSAGALSPLMTSAQGLVVDNKYLYIFEASSKRLAVLDKKDGHLLNQYIISSLQNLKDFAIDESNSLAYFLTDSKIVKIRLQQK